ncbi:hypothetical protein SPBR_01364 [Sporothrix brasiliensis 5110]|uniref:Metalloprotease m41 ftsh n=1 Tax=Sporothrix brasiliensis 5110 TaxID=1398154 RepID=A0A0C2IRS8_9PEZI|nr:uncharacterized protein SPBR_01364 [Sporothrix brasiliensis 5110]KIH91736.1 hypothetical protein SPBR_01364 [Sporothrix brasiliensis 5110]
METIEQLKKELEEQRRRTEEAEARAQQQEARAQQQEARAQQQEARARDEQQQREAAEARARQQEARALAEQRQREAAEARAQQQEARALAEQREREKAEKAVALTDFHTFLSLCHNNLYEHLVIQEDPALSATGVFTNVDSKYYPLCLKPWADFPSLHDRCQTRLDSLFKDKHVFPAVVGFQTMNDILAMEEPLADENDVRMLHFTLVESCARRVLVQYLKECEAALSSTNDTSQYDDGKVSEGNDNSALPIRVYFSNAPHGILLDEPQNSDESQNSDTTPAYMPAMLEAQSRDAEARGRSTGDGPPPVKRKSSPVRKFHPDQWFMRVNSDGSIVPVFVVEYKAAHKLRGSTLKLALSDAVREPQGLFTTAIREQRSNKIFQGDKHLEARRKAEKATARVIAQAFHYMVEFGLCYSYVASGEALILLYLDAADVRTLYYHLALPRDEVTSGGAADHVRHSAVAMVSTMALLALAEPVLSQRWKKEAVHMLKRWPYPYDEMHLLDESSEEEEACVLGLRDGGPLDRDCPNVQLHPTKDGCHTLTAVQFCNRLREQLADNLDENCDALDKYGKFGAIGMLFRLTLQGYGYCVVAKGVQRVHAPRLEQETAIYDHLQEQQGTLVPVCLGVIHLVDVYRTSVGAHVSHMMVISYAGEPIGSKTAGPLPDNIGSLEYNAWVRLRQLGVEHGDERGPNLLWNAPLQRLMCIDFEWSKIINRKRKYGMETHPAQDPPNAGWQWSIPSESLSRETRRSVLI